MREMLPTSARKWLIVGCASISGCMVGPNYERPCVEVPDHWLGQNESAPASLESWWEVFQDPLLNSYMEKALDANYSLQVAEANILKARAVKQIVASQLFPQVTGDLNGTKTYFSKNGPVFAIGPAANNAAVTSSPLTGLPFAVQIPQIQNLFNALFDATWELDLFGKTRRAVESAEAGIESAIEERNGVLLSLRGEIAKNYVELRSFQSAQTLLEKEVEILKEIACITQMQYQGGYVSLFDVEKSMANVQKAEAEIPYVIAEIYRSIFTLSILIGALPETLVEELFVKKDLPTIPTNISAGLRSDLLRNRPDVRKAERELASATASIGVAVASFFPSISLLGMGGLQSLQLPELLQWGSRTWAYGSDVQMPVYQGGRLVGSLHLTQAEQAAAAANYQQVVLGAIQNAESALIFFNQGGLNALHSHGAEAHTKEMYLIENERFIYGLVGKISLLNIEREWIQAQLKALESDSTLLTHAISLYKALGGGVIPFCE